jgi:dipeptide/tripeptide permease
VATAVKDSNPNEVNIAWLIPQYIIITVAEVMVSIFLLFSKYYMYISMYIEEDTNTTYIPFLSVLYKT